MVGRASTEKEYTSEQLLRKVKRMRTAMTMPSILKKKKESAGREMFIDTGEGKVRVLAYNLHKAEKLPLYINIHGGGFTLGSAEMDDPFMANIAEKANVKILSVDYSLAPESPFPKALGECYAVIKYAKGHPEEFGIDPDKIALGGQSAGGNFSAAIGLLEGESRKLGIKCLILDYPPLDVYTDAAQKPQPKGALSPSMCQVFDSCYCIEKESRKNPLVSPVFASPDQVRHFPPTLIITAAKDSLCEETEQFKDKLIEAGVDVTHKRFDAVHGFNLKPGPESDESWQMIIDHLNRYLCENNSSDDEEYIEQV